MNIKKILIELRTALVATFFLAVVLCVIYPLLVWGLAQGLFPDKANGSLIGRNGEVRGSKLLGQGFQGPQYFHPRPSAAGRGYDGSLSGGSNLGPLSKKLTDTVAQRIRDYRRENYLTPADAVPADAVTGSASGLDPHISLQNALFQAARVAEVRGASVEAIRTRIEQYTEGRDLGIFGEPGVNVLKLNLALDEDKD